MTLISYSFCMSMLHSFWQAGSLLLLYFLVDKTFLQQHSPLEKRNLLFVLISTQLALFIITFCIYFAAGQSGNLLGSWGNYFNNLLSAERTQIFTPWIFGAYLFLLAYKVTKAGYTWYHFKAQSHTGLQKPSVHLRLFTESKAHQFGIKKKVNLWLSNNIKTPVTFGFLKPVIVLPVALLNNIDSQQAEALLVHELSHIKTNDYLLNWYLQITQTLFFYNPFLAAMGRNIQMEREKYCDINVMAFSYSPALYAEALLKAERVKQMMPVFQLAAVGRKKQLFERILFFTNSENIKSPKRINLIAPLMGILLLFSLFTIVVFYSAGKPTATGSSYNLKRELFALPKQFDGRVMVKNVFHSFHDLPSPGQVAELEKKGRAIQQKIQKLQPLISRIQNSLDLSSEPNGAGFAIPASINENDAAEQIIVTEESSGSSNSSVKVYRLYFENGKWVVIPEWMALAKVIRDSILNNLDTSSRKELSPQ